MDGFTAVYLRLSKDDKNRSTSESIDNQREFILDYIKKHNLGKYKIYADDGFSGTNFKRPAFTQMLRDIEKKIIHTVVTKDMSRLGRNHIKTSYYIEEYFPERQVRYIALNDSVDTKTNPWDDISPFKAVINEMYSKDLSRKIRTALLVKKKNGKFIGSAAPYGYRKHPLDKNLLVADEKSSQVVKKIFNLYTGGMSIKSIAEKLNSDGEETPSQRINSKNKSCQWNCSTIKNILTNRSYTGDITQNKSMKLSYKINKKILLPESQWICVENTHEAIISKHQFKIASDMLKLKRYSSSGRKSAHMLTGFIFCADCGSPMSFTRQSERSYIVCSGWKRKTPGLNCSSHCCREKYADDTVKNTISRLASENISAVKKFLKTDIKASDITFDNIERAELATLIRKIYISNDKMLTIILK